MIQTVGRSPYVVVDDARSRGGWAVRLAAMESEQERKRRIAYVIRSTRERRGMTPPQLGAKVGRGRGTINAWESGQSTPSLVDLAPLCLALGLDPAVFAELPAIPADPIAAYLRDAAAEAAEEGAERARTRAPRAPGTPARLRALPPGDTEPGSE